MLNAVTLGSDTSICKRIRVGGLGKFPGTKERAGSLRYPLFLAAFQARLGVAGWWGQGSGGTGEGRILTEQSFLAAASALLG